MRVLLLHDYGTESGGAERMSLTLRKGLRARGHDARLLASSAQPLTLPNQADYTCYGTMSPLRRVLQVANPSAAVRLRRVLREFRPDVVHVRMFLTQLSPLVLAPLEDIPSVLHVVNYNLVCPLNTKVLPDGSRCTFEQGRACHEQGCLPLLGIARLEAQRFVWRRRLGDFDAVVANSAWVAGRLGEAGIRVDEVIWNGVARVPRREAPASRATIAFAGRLDQKKGVDVLLAAMVRIAAAVPDAQLLVAGDGPERSRLERLATELALHDRVRFLGHLDRPDLEETLSRASVQVVPSVWDEPFGLVGAEAMMRGTPLVASAVGGLSEYVTNHETGVLVPPADPAALAEAVLSLLHDPALGERLAAAARARAVADLTEERTVARFESLYERIVRNRTLPAEGRRPGAQPEHVTACPPPTAGRG